MTPKQRLKPEVKYRSIDEPDKHRISPVFRFLAGCLAVFMILVAVVALWLDRGVFGKDALMALQALPFAVTFGIAAWTGRSSRASSSIGDDGGSDSGAGGGDGGAG